LHHNQWNAKGASGSNMLYGIRRAIVDLERDDVDHALVNFYGNLAQGLTHDTFIGGEGTSLVPSDKFGRLITLPPNSAANSNILWQLRYMLVQDFDLADDGKPDTLRLLFATPQRWLEDNKTIEVKDAPTAFGPVSITAHARLSQGNVLVDMGLPKAAHAYL